jgi:hypothetical protein
MHEVLPCRGIPNALHRAFDEKIKFLFSVGRRSTWRIVLDPIWDVVFVGVGFHIDLLRHDWFVWHNVSAYPPALTIPPRRSGRAPCSECNSGIVVDTAASPQPPTPWFATSAGPATASDASPFSVFRFPFVVITVAAARPFSGPLRWHGPPDLDGLVPLTTPSGLS